MMKNAILLTGGTGFIGSFLAEMLAQKGYALTALVRSTSDPRAVNHLRKLGAKIVVGDLKIKESLRAAVRGNEIVIHCAAVHDASYPELRATNVDGTRNLLEACAEAGIKRFIHFSSATTYGSITAGTEKSERHPETDYARTKYAGEQIVEEYLHRRAFPITIITPPLVYGPHKRSNMLKWFKYICRRCFLIFGSGRNLIEVIYVSDLVRFVELVLNSKRSHMQAYLISGQCCTMREFTDAIASAAGAPRPMRVPIALAYLLGACLEAASFLRKFDPPVSRTKVRNMSRSRSLDMSKAKRELNYWPNVSVQDGVRKVIQWYRSGKMR